MLYVQISKALRGFFTAALMSYRKLQMNFEDMIFEVNPYDPSVANYDVNRSQCVMV